MSEQSDQAFDATIEGVTEAPAEISVETSIKTPTETPVDMPVEQAHIAESKVEDSKVEEMDDLFGDDDEDSKSMSGSDSEEEDDEEGSQTENDTIQRNRLSLDDDEAEEQAMYTRKFYGEDVDNMSEEESSQHHFKEENVELVRHVVPYRAIDKSTEEKPTIYYSKIPEFLTIDPIPFDPPSFEVKVQERLANSSKEDQMGDSLIDENTIRWRYSRDEKQQVYKESNAQIIEWSDGKFSLKLGDEYTDILINDTENTFFAVSHDQQELMQCVEGGEITKSLMFIPTSTNSKMHQKLTKAVMRRNQRQVSGPGIYIINKDPELEKNELEKQQQQRVRERRKRQLKEIEIRDSPDTAGSLEYSNGFKRNRTSSMEPDSYGSSRRDEYEQDDFLVDDDDDEEVEYAEEDDDELLDHADTDGGAEGQQEDEGEDDARAERLKALKRAGANQYQQSEPALTSEVEIRRRKVAVIDDDEDDE